MQEEEEEEEEEEGVTTYNLQCSYSLIRASYYYCIQTYFNFEVYIY